MDKQPLASYYQRSQHTHLCNGLHACLRGGYRLHTGHKGSQYLHVSKLQATEPDSSCSDCVSPHGESYLDRISESEWGWRVCFAVCPPAENAWGAGWGCQAGSISSSLPSPAASVYSGGTSTHHLAPAARGIKTFAINSPELICDVCHRQQINVGSQMLPMWDSKSQASE